MSAKHSLWDDDEPVFATIKQDVQQAGDFLSLIFHLTHGEENKRRKQICIKSAQHIIKQLPGLYGPGIETQTMDAIMHDTDDIDFAHAFFLMLIPQIQPFAKMIEETVSKEPREQLRWRCFVEHLVACRHHLIDGFMKSGERCQAATDVHFSTLRSFVWTMRAFYLRRACRVRPPQIQPIRRAGWEHKDGQKPSADAGTAYIAITLFFMMAMRLGDYSNLNREDPKKLVFETRHVVTQRTRLPPDTERLKVLINSNLTRDARPGLFETHSLALLLRPAPVPTRSS